MAPQRVPPVHRHPPVPLSALQRRSLLPTAAALPHVHGLSPARNTTTAPSRPGPIGRRRAQPDPRVGYTATRQSQGGSHVHCDSLDEGGAQLYPCGIATTTPQHVTVASRTATHMTVRKFPAPDPPARVRTAPGPYPPGLSRFTFRGT